MTVKTITGTQLLVEMRDTILKDAAAEMAQAEQDLELAKQNAAELIADAKVKYHKTKIATNQARRKAEAITACIDKELESEAKNLTAVQDAYRFKSVAELAAEWETNGLSMTHVERVNGEE